jgi:hypothetical protein
MLRGCQYTWAITGWEGVPIIRDKNEREKAKKRNKHARVTAGMLG